MSDDERKGDDWRASVDGRLLARVEAHVTNGMRLTRDWSVPINLREQRTHLDPADWRTGFLRVERQVETPPALADDLRENMPQALLRDLYRPVHEERWVEREIVEGTGGRDTRSVMESVRAARQVPARSYVEPGTRVVGEYLSWRRALLAERWRPVRDKAAESGGAVPPDGTRR